MSWSHFSDDEVKEIKDECGLDLDAENGCVIYTAEYPNGCKAIGFWSSPAWKGAAFQIVPGVPGCLLPLVLRVSISIQDSVISSKKGKEPWKRNCSDH